MNKKYIQIATFGLLAVLTVIVRLFPHLPNVVPLGALALVAGMYLSGRYALALIVTVLGLTDFILGGYSFGVMVVVYSGFGLYVAIGRYLRDRRTWEYFIVGSFLSSLLFYVSTNTAVWAFTLMYPRTMSGLADALVAGIPFFRNSLGADMVYGLAFFAVAQVVLDVSFRVRFISLIRRLSNQILIFVTHT